MRPRSGLRLCGERLLPWELVVEIVDAWLDTPFDGGRHARRISQLDAP